MQRPNYPASIAGTRNRNAAHQPQADLSERITTKSDSHSPSIYGTNFKKQSQASRISATSRRRIFYDDQRTGRAR